MTKYYAVIDTNVIVSSFLKSDSIPRQIVDFALTGPIIPLLSKEIIKEYKTVLLRNRFGFNKDKIEIFISELFKRAYFIDRTKTDELFIDQSDVVFYEVVLTARHSAGAYLITGNKKHFPVKPYVVTPREMLKIIEENM